MEHTDIKYDDALARQALERLRSVPPAVLKDELGFPDDIAKLFRLDVQLAVTGESTAVLQPTDRLRDFIAALGTC